MAMHLHYKTYAIITHRTDSNVLFWRDRIHEYLKRTHTSLSCVDPEHAELLLILGGDGTFCETMRLLGPSPRHLLALNTGQVGFLTSAQHPSQFFEMTDAAVRGELLKMPIHLLRIRHRSENRTQEHVAVNDLFLERAMTWITIRLHTILRSSQECIGTFRGSGVFACTALGSTTSIAAHLGSPIIDPRWRSIFIKQLYGQPAPTQGSLVSGERQRVRILVERIEQNPGIPELYRHPPDLFLDGRHVATITAGDTIELSFTPHPHTLLRAKGDTFWERIRTRRSR